MTLEQRLAAALTQVIREAVRDELAALHRADPDEWIPHTRWPVKSRRVACELAREGSVAARRKGKLWLARRKDIDAWVAKQAPEALAPKPPKDEPANYADAMTNAARPKRKKAA